MSDIRTRAAEHLLRARDRSTALTDAVDDDDLVRQHSRLMSPLVWDLAHVGNQEELWLVRDVGRREPVRSDIDELYDAFKHRRASRPSLPLLGPAEARAYVREVRDKVLDVLDTTRLEGTPLVQDGFAFGMVAQHEQQHDETMLATHQLRIGVPVLHAEEPPAAPAPLEGKEVLVPAGEFTMGTSTEPWALDNERPAHPSYTEAYLIDTAPVTYGEYLRFVEAGGYQQERWWSPAGWRHVQEAGLEAPQFLTR
ncbi:MAG TPA: DinB family protein, partial [Nocardioidaceae bacterium]|nr:DinB family protein [Nocardioidaceae bacterium]